MEGTFKIEAETSSTARMPHPSEIAEVLAFLKQELRPDQSWPIEAEYPTALSTQNVHNMRIVKEQNQIVSHAVMKSLIVKSPTALFKVGCIGSVVTHSKYRGQGHSRTIIESCIEELSKQDCDIAILWTNLYDFYRKFNFELAGSEVSICINSIPENISTEKLQFKKGVGVSAESLLRLYQTHSVHSVRTADEIRKFLQIPQTQLYTAWNAQGDLVAYAVEGKGADLTNYIHEWGGSVPSILSLLKFIFESEAKEKTMILPAHSENLVRHLQKQYVANHGYLGMIRILKHDQLFTKVKKHARALGYTDFVLEKKGSDIFMGFGTDLIAINDDRAMVAILFGPVPEMPFENTDNNKKLETLLPLPLWIWGWDSI